MNICPCCSGHPYQECCEILHKGTPAGNAFDLMRSRYSAYALHLPDYIIETTHEENPKRKENRDYWRKEILLFCENTTFIKLKVLNFMEEGDKACVNFIAYLNQNQKDIQLHENSYFEKVGAIWLYREALSLNVTN